MYVEKFECEFIDLIPLYRASDRKYPPSIWATSRVGLNELLALAQKMRCRVGDIYISRQRGKLSTCWVHPQVVLLWQDWVKTQQLRDNPVIKRIV